MMDDSMVLVGILALTYAAMFVVTKHRQGLSVGMYRSYCLLGALGLMGIVALPNLWLQGLFVVMLVNLFRDPAIGVHLSRVLPLLLMVVGGVLVMERSDLSIVFPLLAVIVVGGVLLTGYAVYFLSQNWPMPKHLQLTCGQENVNNVQAISVMGVCAAGGLAWGQGAWWLVPLVVVAFPMLWATVHDWRHERTVPMGPVILVGVGLCLLPLVIGWWAALLLPVVLTGVAVAVVQAFRLEKWWDSGRIRCWYTMLLIGWWREGWAVRLLGRGWQSWVQFNDFIIDVARKTNRGHIVHIKSMMSTAHNEFVQMLFEHGIVGAVLLAGYVLTGLWQLGHGGPEAQAVYVAALGMCGVACTLHPWTWTHGTITEIDDKTMLWTIGSPALNWLALLVAVLVEVAR